MLQALEREAASDGMRLNFTQTKLLMNEGGPSATLWFIHDEAVPTTTQARYLGSMVSLHLPLRTAFRRRCVLAEEADKKRLVWNSSLNISIKMKFSMPYFPQSFFAGWILSHTRMDISNKQMRSTLGSIVGLLAVSLHIIPEFQTLQKMIRQADHNTHPTALWTPSTV